MKFNVLNKRLTMTDVLGMDCGFLLTQQPTNTDTKPQGSHTNNASSQRRFLVFL